jgi:hypothetical protein
MNIFLLFKIKLEALLIATLKDKKLYHIMFSQPAAAEKIFVTENLGK